MQIQHIGYRIKKFYRFAKLSCLVETMTPEIARRLKVLRHWQAHGLASALDAFEISRSTLYAWRKRYADSRHNPAYLAPASKAPKRPRTSSWPAKLVSEIKRLRQQHPNLGKEKCFALLLPFCQSEHLPCPSVSTIGRIIASQPNKLHTTPIRLSPKGKPKPIKKTSVLRKPKNLKRQACQCLAFDTIVRQRDGIKRYILTAIDPITHLAFAYAPQTPSSHHAAQLHLAITTTFPDFANAAVLTDNGAEFKGAFQSALSEQQLTHWHTYPRTPKMNAHSERFNRSIQESFVDYHEDLLFSDITLFNQKMTDWIVFYNTQLPHLGNQPHPKKSTSLYNLPITPLQSQLLHLPASSMYWTNTLI
jgi:transposase InsO family protein